MTYFEKFDGHIYNCIDDVVLNILKKEVGEYWRILSHQTLHIKYDEISEQLDYMFDSFLALPQFDSVKKEYGIEFFESDELKEGWNVLFLPKDECKHISSDEVMWNDAHAVIIEKKLDCLQLIDPAYGITAEIDDSFINYESQTVLNFVKHFNFKEELLSTSEILEKIKDICLILEGIYDEAGKFFNNDSINNPDIYDFLAEHLIRLMRQEFRFNEYFYHGSKLMKHTEELLLYSIYFINFNLIAEWKSFRNKLSKQKIKKESDLELIKKIRNKLANKINISFLSSIHSKYLDIHERVETLYTIFKKYFKEKEINRNISDSDYNNMLLVIGEAEVNFNIEIDPDVIFGVETLDDFLKKLTIAITKSMISQG